MQYFQKAKKIFLVNLQLIVKTHAPIAATTQNACAYFAANVDFDVVVHFVAVNDVTT